MFQKFFTNTIESKFIKSLLYDTYIPIFNTVSVGDWIINGCQYVFGSNIIKCTKSGCLNEISYDYYDNLCVTDCEENIHKTDSLCDSCLVASDELLCGTTTQIGAYDVIDSVRDSNDKIQNVTNFYSRSTFYDSETHEALGNYLRWYRDVQGIDLMPFYNCFSYRVLTGVYLDPKTSTIVNKDNPKYKLYLVPIRFNKHYTIALDSPSTVVTKAVVYGDNGFIYQYTDNNLNSITDMLSDYVTTYNRTSFRQPIHYSLSTDDKSLYSLENALYLVIQVSAKNNSSLVVLEGNYSPNVISKHYTRDTILNTHTSQINKVLFTTPSLLQINDTNMYAYSDRLIEYLLLNVISSADTIDGNIAYTQYLLKDDCNIEYTRGVWDDYIREYLFSKASAHHLWDVNGFIDKSIDKHVIVVNKQEEFYNKELIRNGIRW